MKCEVRKISYELRVIRHHPYKVSHPSGVVIVGTGVVRCGVGPLVGVRGSQLPLFLRCKRTCLI